MLSDDFAGASTGWTDPNGRIVRMTSAVDLLATLSDDEAREELRRDAAAHGYVLSESPGPFDGDDVEHALEELESAGYVERIGGAGDPLVGTYLLTWPDRS
jgi:hypothetical protein